MNYLRLSELKDGYLYRIRARNGAFGIWIETRNAFILSRTKFDSNYPFEEYHYDTGAPFGTVKPLEEIERSPFNTAELKIESWVAEDGRRVAGYKKDIEILVYLNKFEVPYMRQRIIDMGYGEDKADEQIRKNNYITEMEED